MAQEQFGVMFMDGSKRKSRKTVEQLKNESAYLAIQQELDAQKIALDTQTARWMELFSLTIFAREENHFPFSFPLCSGTT